MSRSLYRPSPNCYPHPLTCAQGRMGQPARSEFSVQTGQQRHPYQRPPSAEWACFRFGTSPGPPMWSPSHLGHLISSLLFIFRVLRCAPLHHTFLSDSPLQRQQWISMKDPSPAPCNTLYGVYRNTRGRLTQCLVFLILPSILDLMSAFPGTLFHEDQSPSSSAPLHFWSYSYLCLGCCLFAICLALLWVKLNLLFSCET